MYFFENMNLELREPAGNLYLTQYMTPVYKSGSKQLRMQNLRKKQTIPLNIIFKLKNLNILLFGKGLKCYIFKTILYLSNTADILFTTR